MVRKRRPSLPFLKDQSLSITALLVLLAAPAVITESRSYSIPSYLQICHTRSSDLNTCLKDSVNVFIRNIKNGSVEMNIPKIDPMDIPFLEMDIGSGNASLQMFFKNVKLIGLSSIDIIAVRPLIEERKIEISSKVPYIHIFGEFNCQGNILEFPLSSQGAFGVNMTDSTAVWILYFEDLEVNGTQFFLIESFGADVVPTIISYHFGDTFDGDNKLGEAVNMFMNRNSQEIFNNVKPKIMKTLSVIMSVIANQVLSSYPKHVLFPV